MAVKAGAERVYDCEASEVMVVMAKDKLMHNVEVEKVRVIPKWFLMGVSFCWCLSSVGYLECERVRVVADMIGEGDREVGLSTRRIQDAFSLRSCFL